MTLCEIRVPTYRRSNLVRRSLLSIVSQTHEDWICVVFDDSPDREGKAVVAAVSDPRVEYVANTRRLGAAGNLDQAFESQPLRNGRFACVVEDDNYLLPTFLSENLDAIKKTDSPVVFRNQLVEEVDCPDRPGRLTTRTTLGDVYAEGVYSPLEILPSVFFSGGVSNGSLFWDVDCRSQFRIGPRITNTIVQEYVRCLRIQDNVVFKSEPLAVWRKNEAESVNRRHRGLVRNRLHFARTLRSVQAVRRQAYERLRRAGRLDLLFSSRLRARPEVIERGLLHAGIYSCRTKLSPLARTTALLKGLAFRTVYPGVPGHDVTDTFSPANVQHNCLKK